MKNRVLMLFAVLIAAGLVLLTGSQALAQKPIVIGAPLSTAFLYGWDAARGMKLAIEEINSKEGVTDRNTRLQVPGINNLHLKWTFFPTYIDAPF